MAKRYRYAFATEKEAEDGVLAAILAGVSLGLFLIDLILSCNFQGEGISGPIMGGLGTCGVLLSLYGFIIGLRSFRRQDRTHRLSTLGSIADGILMIVWLGLYLMGL